MCLANPTDKYARQWSSSPPAWSFTGLNIYSRICLAQLITLSLSADDATFLPNSVRQLYSGIPVLFLLKTLFGCLVPRDTYQLKDISIYHLYSVFVFVLGFERDEDNVSFYWDNKGPGSIVPIPLTLYYHGGGVLPLSQWNENFSTETISNVLV